MTLTPEQIKDALTDEESNLYDTACFASNDSTYGIIIAGVLESLAECRIENERLKDALKMIRDDKHIESCDPDYGNDPMCKCHINIARITLLSKPEPEADNV